MSNVVKCNSCNVVINELLSYIQNKLSVIDEDTLVRVCTSTFSSEEIAKSKALLFESISADKAKLIKRKNKGKEQRDLADIVNIFKTAEPDLFPVFVARELERLPPILFDHLDCTKLLKDLLRVQNELEVFKETYVTQTQLSDFKEEMLKLQYDSLVPPPPVCNVNMKRGAWLTDSGPIGLSHVSNSSSSIDCDTDLEKISQQSCKNISKTVECEQTETSRQAVVGILDGSEPKLREEPAAADVSRVTSPRAPIVTSRERLTTSPVPAVRVNHSKTNNSEIASDHLNATSLVNDHKCVQNDDQGWQKVSHRRKNVNYRYSGTAGIARDNQGRFKAAFKSVPIFITKVHKDTTEKDIVDYIYQKTQVKISLQLITGNHDRDYNAYKCFVAEDKLSLFLDCKLWPEGIIFRRFVNYKTRKPNPNGDNKNTVNGHN